MLGTADEVVLIDLTPEDLIERLRAGKVYPAEHIQAALENFFRVENLAALREMALRQVAEEVESKRLVVETAEPLSTREERVEDAVPKAVGERLLALIRPRRSSQRLVRRAWRSSQRLGTDLDLLWVKRPQERMTDRKEKQLRAAPPARLGAGCDAARRGERRRRRRDRRGRPRARHHLHLRGRVRAAPMWRRLREPLPQRLMRATPRGVDVRIVAYRGQPDEEEP